jgi:hypothetical protein
LNICYLPDAETHRLWPQIRALLEPAAGDVPVEYEHQCVWLAHEGGTVFAAATTILWGNGEAELRFAGGCRHKDWVPQLSDTVSAWAKAAGARKLTMKGRKGWARYARDLGWATLGEQGGDMIYQKEL